MTDREKQLSERIDELQYALEVSLRSITDTPDPDLKIRLLQTQVRVLADRLAIAVAIFNGCEIDCGIGGNAEGAEYWEKVQRMITGRDDPALNFAREEQRKFGEYRLALTQIRQWLSRSLAKSPFRREREKKAA